MNAVPDLSPVIILVEPQMGENIGAAARAMANFGLSELRLVAPRDGWPNEKARANAASAEGIVTAAKVFATLEAAIADLHMLYATTARDRDVSKRVCGPGQAVAAMRELAAGGARAGILFGRERSGLSNEEVSRADEIVTLPVDPAFASLNIAQAVLILAYEWRKAGFANEAAGLPWTSPERSALAGKEMVTQLFGHLEHALDARGFFRPPEKKAGMINNLRAIFMKAALTEQEVRTLRGAISALELRHLMPRGLRAKLDRPLRAADEKEGGDDDPRF